MKLRPPFKVNAQRSKSDVRKSGFTLIEIILVAVVITIITGIALPYFSGSYKGNKLRLSARTISRMSRYARAMSIMREEQMTVVLNHETMEVWLGGFTAAKANSADGELDQDVLDRLGYTDGDSDSSKNAGIEREPRAARSSPYARFGSNTPMPRPRSG